MFVVSDNIVPTQQYNISFFIYTQESILLGCLEALSQTAFISSSIKSLLCVAIKYHYINTFHEETLHLLTKGSQAAVIKITIIKCHFF